MNTALLIMDVQPATLGMLGDHAAAYSANITKAIAAARAIEDWMASFS